MEENTTKKLSYEELEAYAAEVSQLAQRLSANLIGINNVFKRLDYLFKVLECANVFNNTFVDKCVKEVEELMTPEEKESNEQSQ